MSSLPKRPCFGCSETFNLNDKRRMPHILRCGHVRCGTCIRAELSKDGLVECSACEVVTIPEHEGGEWGNFSLKDFPIAKTLFGYIHMVNNAELFECKEQLPVMSLVSVKNDSVVIYCVACEENTKIAEVFCQDCQVNLCRPCFNSSHKPSFLQKHVTTPPVSEKPKYDCPAHPENSLENVCKTCNEKYLCAVCLADHDHHDVITYPNWVKEKIPGVDELKKQLKNGLNEVKNCQRIVETGKVCELLGPHDLAFSEYSQVILNLVERSLYQAGEKIREKKINSLKTSAQELYPEIAKLASEFEEMDTIFGDVAQVKKMDFDSIKNNLTHILAKPRHLELVQPNLKINPSADLVKDVLDRLDDDLISISDSISDVKVVLVQKEECENLRDSPIEQSQKETSSSDIDELILDDWVIETGNMPPFQGSVAASSCSSKVQIPVKSEDFVDPEVMKLCQSIIFKKPFFIPGECLRVKLLNIDDPRNVSVTLLYHEPIREKIQKCLDMLVLKKLRSQPNRHKNYLVIEEGNARKRCSLLNILQGDTTEFEVDLIDEGRAARVELQQLYLLPSCLSTLPGLAIYCELDDCEQISRYWRNYDPKLISQFIAANRDDVFTMTVMRSGLGALCVDLSFVTSNGTRALMVEFLRQMSNKCADVASVQAVHGVKKKSYPGPRIFFTNYFRMKSLHDYRVVLSHAVSPSCFYLQSVNSKEKINKISRHLANFFGSVEPFCKYKFTNAPKIGEGVAVTHNSMYYRGKVITQTFDSEEEGYDEVGDKVKVMLVDIGTEVIAKWQEEILQLEADMFAPQCEAYCCKLHKLVPPATHGFEWPLEAKVKLEEMCNSAYMRKIDVIDATQESLSVELYICADKRHRWINVSDELAKKGLAARVELAPLPQPFPEKSFGKKNNYTNNRSLIRSTFVSKKSRTYLMDNSHLSLDSSSSDDERKKRDPFCSSDSENEQVEQEQNEYPNKLKVNIIAFCSPDKIFVIPECYQNEVNDYVKRMTLYYEDPCLRRQHMIKEKDFAVGLKCAIRMHDKWYRCLVADVLPNRELNLTLVDYGKFLEGVSMDIVFELKPDFSLLRPAVLKCHLVGIVPTAGLKEWANATLEYAQEELNKFQDFYISVKKCANYGDSLPVELFVKNCPKPGPLEPSIVVLDSLGTMLADAGYAILKKDFYEEVDPDFLKEWRTDESEGIDSLAIDEGLTTTSFASSAETTLRKTVSEGIAKVELLRRDDGNANVMDGLPCKSDMMVNDGFLRSAESRMTMKDGILEGKMIAKDELSRRDVGDANMTDRLSRKTDTMGNDGFFRKAESRMTMKDGISEGKTIAKDELSRRDVGDANMMDGLPCKTDMMVNDGCFRKTESRMTTKDGIPEGKTIAKDELSRRDVGNANMMDRLSRKTDMMVNDGFFRKMESRMTTKDGIPDGKMIAKDELLSKVRGGIVTKAGSSRDDIAKNGFTRQTIKPACNLGNYSENGLENQDLNEPRLLCHANEAKDDLGSHWLPVAPLEELTLKVYVTYVEKNQNVLYFHSADKTTFLDKLTTDLNEFMKSLRNIEPPMPVSSVPCIAKYPADNQWHRAVIVQPFLKNQAEMFEVQFVDYGNCSEVNVRDVSRQVTMMDVPIQAVKCMLDIAQTNDVKVPNEVILKSLDSDEMFTFTLDLIQDENNDCQYAVKKIALENGKDLVEILGSGQKSTPWLPALKFEELEFRGIITHIDPDGHVYLHNVKDNDCKRKLDADFTDYVNDLEVRPRPILINGEPCFVLAENKWYRGEIIRVLYVDNRAEVRLVDYGKEVTVDIDTQLCAQVMFRDIPLQTHKCDLDIEPRDGDNWTDKALKAICYGIVDRPHQIVVGEFVKTEKNPQGSGYTVLSVRIDDMTNVFEMLISQRLARYKRHIIEDEENNGGSSPFAPNHCGPQSNAGSRQSTNQNEGMQQKNLGENINNALSLDEDSQSVCPSQSSLSDALSETYSTATHIVHMVVENDHSRQNSNRDFSQYEQTQWKGGNSVTDDYRGSNSQYRGNRAQATDLHGSNSQYRGNRAQATDLHGSNSQYRGNRTQAVNSNESNSQYRGNRAQAVDLNGSNSQYRGSRSQATYFGGSNMKYRGNQQQATDFGASNSQYRSNRQAANLESNSQYRGNPQADFQECYDQDRNLPRRDFSPKNASRSLGNRPYKKESDFQQSDCGNSQYRFYKSANQSGKSKNSNDGWQSVPISRNQANSPSRTMADFKPNQEKRWIRAANSQNFSIPALSSKSACGQNANRGSNLQGPSGVTSTMGPNSSVTENATLSLTEFGIKTLISDVLLARNIKQFQLSFTYVDTSTEYCGRLLQSSDPMIAEIIEAQNALESSLQEFGESQPLPIGPKGQGDFCLFKYSVDGMWYRAKVVEIKFEMERNTLEMVIEYIDYGNTETVKVGTDERNKNMRELRQEWMKLPAFCFKMSLHGISVMPGTCADNVYDIETMLEGMLNERVKTVLIKDISVKPFACEIIDDQHRAFVDQQLKNGIFKKKN